MKAAFFIGSLVIPLLLSAIIIGGGFPPLLYLMGVALFLGVTGILIEKPVYFPSLCLALSIVIIITGVAVYPRILSATAQTPSQHFQAAQALAADWRIPFQSESAAWSHYVSAAEGGIPQAECIVGMAYLYHHYGVPFDRIKAKLWLEAAAKQGDVSAQRELGNVDTVPGT